MLDDRQLEVRSIEQLISSLEHIEEMQFQSDIRENVLCELKRMRGNVSAVLAFVSHGDDASLAGPAHAELGEALKEVRRQCLLLNATIAKIIVLQWSPAGLVKWIEDSSGLMEQYRELAQAARRLCQITAPQLSADLARAL
jgi:hypothetical protein